MFQKEAINNDLYRDLGEKWYYGNDYIGLLRSESKTRNPWILNQIQNQFQKSVELLDIGCGGGLLTNDFAKQNFNITGVDIHDEVLQIAKNYDPNKKVKYIKANALSLPFENESFDVVCALDFLEHVDNFHLALSEGVRVLKKNGLFFFHTFNRNILSWIFVIKGMEWFVKRTPKNLHVFHLFIKPEELINCFSDLGCQKIELHGLNPKIFSRSFFKLIRYGVVDKDFKFEISSSLKMGYIGYVKKL
ncbi:bifunctional 2-polyprenyl-6-hydroxyphenol methylase/3-demethylubiquinol 3-O-methyltransferase UbiG [Silvanigrella aquatica]|uniref:3-demethylubiquinone-9 3-O-methyltransferase n=1 Tax=Silvanigrella aquatica TaxID=1915309 RepID=A0A1L4CX80_9BACT|nr:bifunctional 2-polyprenyl-6-hydroxyphenol methylase/3-demethylubiquinol 3-O-methyltransferase UbiG [Silvanigrella aquatica]APJ02554.1 3-demethylubiquinone-9 3-O-methyltransferase [Silvanigrella aquatica]